MRTFIALELSAEVQQALAEVQNALRAEIPRARWTNPRGTHLTIKFLGEARESQIREISAGLDQISVAFTTFTVSLAGVGAFPRLAAPRVLWVGIENQAELSRLQNEIERAIAPLGFPAEQRAFKPHLTLARLDGEPWPQALRQRFLDSSTTTSGINWQISQIVLFRSELLKGGAVYTPLHISGFLPSA